MVFEIVHDGALEFGDALEDAATDAISGDLGEEALNHVEPGRRGRGEVQVEARMCPEPALYRRGLVSGIVVDDQMKIEIGGVCGSISLRKRRNSRWRWRGRHVPMTLPSSMFSAANRVVVPLRL